MKNTDSNILDEGIYFTEEEEAAYDQGFEEGFEAGILQLRFSYALWALGWALLMYAIFGK